MRPKDPCEGRGGAAFSHCDGRFGTPRRLAGRYYIPVVAAACQARTAACLRHWLRGSRSARVDMLQPLLSVIVVATKPSLQTVRGHRDRSATDASPITRPYHEAHSDTYCIRAQQREELAPPRRARTAPAMERPLWTLTTVLSVFSVSRETTRGLRSPFTNGPSSGQRYRAFDHAMFHVEHCGHDDV